MNRHHFSLSTFFKCLIENVTGKRIFRWDNLDLDTTEPAGADFVSDLFYEIKTERGYILAPRSPRKTK